MSSTSIRRYRSADLPALQRITVEAFDGVSIDRNIEDHFGVINGQDWRFRKARHIAEDAARDADGIFVAVTDDDQIVGYISTWCDRPAGIGNIPNLAIDSAYRRQGLGKQLIRVALDHFAAQGMSHARIETLAQNDVGQSLYPSMGFAEVARQVHFCMKLDAEPRSGGT